MFHLRKFKTYSTYKQYMQSGDIYLPRVAMIVNAGDNATSVDITSDEYGPTWVDFQRADTQFVRIANGGTMLLYNQIAVDGKYDYIAEYTDDGIVFHVYHTGTTNEIQTSDADYDTYAIKYLPDGTVQFPQIERVTSDDTTVYLKTEKIAYLDDIARLDDNYIIL